MKGIVFLGWLLLFFSSALAQENPEEFFQSANQVYDKKDYRTAIAGYQALLEDNVVTPAIYYNLGNAHFRQGELGRAVLAYRRALKLAPSDREAMENLEFVRRYQTDQIKPQQSTFFLTFSAQLPGKIGVNSLAWLCALLWWILFGVLALYFVLKKKTRMMRLGLGICLVVLILSASLLWTGLVQAGKEAGVILSAQVDAKSGPGKDYVNLFTIHQGLECRVEEQKGEWCLILLPNQARGWVPKASLELI